jgi:hypothetical protein
MAAQRQDEFSRRAIRRRINRSRRYRVGTQLPGFLLLFVGPIRLSARVRRAIDGYAGNLGCRFHCGVSNPDHGIGGSHHGAASL